MEDNEILNGIFACRFYTGKEAEISITDLELVKRVTVKDSSNFINREVKWNIVRISFS